MLIISTYFSIIIQVITGIINLWGLHINIDDNKKIFKDLLNIELFIQNIELVFYIWMANNLNIIQNITPYRYLDWIITTPTMLITLMAFLDKDKNNNLYNYIQKNKYFIIKIIVLNLIMLLFGLAGELKYLDYNSAIMLGFIPFIYYFKLIHDKYIIKKSSSENINTYWFYFIIWSLYGIVAFLSYEYKNSAYNIIDLFSKNFFSLFLVYLLWKNQKKIILI
jgi:bacteriorhodopsin